MAFCDRLKKARLSKGLTQKQLGAQIGIAGTTITGYEKGTSEPNMAVIQKLMEVLNVDANYLWQDEMGDGFKTNVSYEELDHLKKYRRLDTHGKEIVDIVLDKELQRVEHSKNNIKPLKPDHLRPQAAHLRTDIEVTPEGIQADDDIMNNDDEWK